MDAAPRITLEQADEIKAETAFAVELGYQTTEIGPGTATVTLSPQPRHLRPGDMVAGPILVGIADFAFWIAAQSLIGKEPMAVTLEETSAFLSPARGDLRCEAKVLKSGARVIYGVATTFDASDRAVAHHTFTYLRPA